MSYRQPTRAWKLNATEYNKTQRINAASKVERRDKRIFVYAVILIALFIVA